MLLRVSLLGSSGHSPAASCMIQNSVTHPCPPQKGKSSSATARRRRSTRGRCSELLSRLRPRSTGDQRHRKIRNTRSSSRMHASDFDIVATCRRSCSCASSQEIESDSRRTYHWAVGFCSSAIPASPIHPRVTPSCFWDLLIDYPCPISPPSANISILGPQSFYQDTHWRRQYLALDQPAFGHWIPP